MKIIRKAACAVFAVCIVFFTVSCSNTKEDVLAGGKQVDTDEAAISDLFGNDDNATAETTTETETIQESDALDLNYMQIDLNRDGIPEDFFIGNDVYEIKLYTDRSPLGYHSFTLPRVESIDIYRRAFDDSEDEFAYSFSCVFGSDKYISFNLVYTGCGSDKCISGMGFEQSLAPCISYHEWFSTMPQEEFEKLMEDPHYYFKECFKPEWEYIQTLNLEEIVNSGCIQSYIQNISIGDDINEIQMFSLKNDIFNKKIKLTNEKYSVYVSDFDYIEIYERNAIMEMSTGELHVYDHMPQDEKDYLLCLKSTESESTECVYLGTADESYLFLYNFNYNDNGFSDENADSLKEDGWQYVRSLDVDVSE